MHSTGKLTGFGNAQLSDLKSNNTYNFKLTVAGSYWGNGECEGSGVQWEGRWIKDVVGVRHFHLRLTDYTAAVLHASGDVILKEGLVCAYVKSTCEDGDLGRVYWETTRRVCTEDDFDLLYSGDARVSGSYVETKDYSNSLMRVRSKEFNLFAMIKGPINTCGATCYSSEYPGLRICFGASIVTFERKILYAQNIDPFRYVNTKIASLARGTETQLNRIYIDVIQQVCNTERMVLINRLEILKLSPESGGVLTLGEKGHFARQAGEVLHLVKCPAIIVKLRDTSRCSMEIPVTAYDAPYFLTPHTRILTKDSVTIECSRASPPTFNIRGQWLAQTPQWMKVPDPKILSPKTSKNIDFAELSDFNQNGIYSELDLQRMREFINFPSRKANIINNIVRTANGEEAQGKYDLTKLVSEAGWENIAKRNIQKIWGVFTWFGNAVSGLIGFWFIIMVLWTVLNCLLRCCHNYKQHGRSWRLAASLSDTLTMFVNLFTRSAVAPEVQTQAITTTAPESENTMTPDPLPEPVNPDRHPQWIAHGMRGAHRHFDDPYPCMASEIELLAQDPLLLECGRSVRDRHPDTHL